MIKYNNNFLSVVWITNNWVSWMYHRRFSFANTIVGWYRQINPVTLISSGVEFIHVFCLIADCRKDLIKCFTTAIVSDCDCVSSDGEFRPTIRSSPAQYECKSLVIKISELHIQANRRSWWWICLIQSKGWYQSCTLW